MIERKEVSKRLIKIAKYWAATCRSVTGDEAIQVFSVDDVPKTDPEAFVVVAIDAIHNESD